MRNPTVLVYANAGTWPTTIDTAIGSAGPSTPVVRTACPELVSSAFVRVVTNRRLFKNSTTPSEALSFTMDERLGDVLV